MPACCRNIEPNRDHFVHSFFMFLLESRRLRATLARLPWSSVTPRSLSPSSGITLAFLANQPFSRSILKSCAGKFGTQCIFPNLIQTCQIRLCSTYGTLRSTASSPTARLSVFSFSPCPFSFFPSHSTMSAETHTADNSTL